MIPMFRGGGAREVQTGINWQVKQLDYNSNVSRWGGLRGSGRDKLVSKTTRL